ncbi:G-PROTEIN-RECEP-F1-2 domain-containing protein [Aphelenchoides besseyi]|nr:G-PROTEIN-RECEP-F1-2 domain-containing protein [Aphelenchoides besseyi]KAI6200628.1 G-PROTEIN-RECEP-F1-2 domain-containing protein [Aphelenchoides besseyi]
MSISNDSLKLMDGNVELVDFKIDINHTELAIVYRQLNEQRACLQLASEPLRCEEGEFHRMLMGNGFIFLCALAIVGNCLNLLVYGSDNTRFFIAIRMLCTKVLVNTLTCLVLLPQALRSIPLWEPGSETDQLYWKAWPLLACFVNIFGFCGMWLTVLIITEIYIHVFFPHTSKSICTYQNLYRSYILIIIVAISLGVIYPINRHVDLRTECGQVDAVVVAGKSSFFNLYERINVTLNMTFAIVIPLALLVGMSIAITYRLVGKSQVLLRAPTSGGVGRFGTEKRTVTRIALITTVLQLIGELPSVPIFVYVALSSSPFIEDDTIWCRWQTLSQFLGYCNVSISFFVYAVFSPRFRQSIQKRFCARNGLTGRLSRSSPSQKHSTTKLEDAKLLATRSLTSVQRHSSASSDDTFRQTPARHYLTVCANTQRLSLDSTNTAAKTSDVINLL